MNKPATEWYWDLKRNKAVPAGERGRGDHMLGPYRTKGEAHNWKVKVDDRNQSWDDDDERWNRWGGDSKPEAK